MFVKTVVNNLAWPRAIVESTTGYISNYWWQVRL